jgi:hypothetical protein
MSGVCTAIATTGQATTTTSGESTTGTQVSPATNISISCAVLLLGAIAFLQ